LERIREIGVRRAVGATRRDVLLQFLSEAILISIAGGVAGILFGTGLSAGIRHFAGIQTIVSYLSVVVAFGVSISVGLRFGIIPAYRAARQDPVICLRYEWRPMPLSTLVSCLVLAAAVLPLGAQQPLT